MVKYFRNPVSGHTQFFDMSKCQRLTINAAYMAGKPATFLKALGVELSVKLECRWAESVPQEHELRIYSVHPHVRRG